MNPRLDTDRRTFLGALAASALAPAALARIPLSRKTLPGAELRFAVIADLHHGLAPDALDRLRSFVEAVGARDDLEFVLQMGDFCHAGREPAPCLDLWNSIDLPRHHVLGNHDMDTCTKDEAVAAWGMERRYYAWEAAGWRFAVLDLNHINDGGESVPYANANFYVDASRRAWADTEQLKWLDKLLADDKPTIVLSHQPLGFWPEGEASPPQQQEVLDVLAPGGEARPAVAALVCGHMHVDRVERYAGIPCWCVNSASYLWSGGMVPYAEPLFAFVTLTPEGDMVVEGVEGAWRDPDDERTRHPDRPWIRPSILDKSERLASRR